MIGEFATGFGKTRAGAESMKVLGGTWLIVHYREAHKTTWEDELDKKSPYYDYKYCGYQSLHKHVGKYYTGIIIDEAHHISKASLTHLKGINCTYRIALSGTIPASKKSLLMQWATFKLNRMNIVQAIKLGILPKPKIIYVPLKLNDDIKDTYRINRKGKKAPWRTITYFEYTNYPGIHSAYMNYYVTCGQMQYYSLLEGDMNYWKGQYLEEKEDWMKDMWMKHGLDRKKYLSKVKQLAIAKIHNKMKEANKRFLVFLQDSSYIVSLIGENNSSFVYHKNKNNLLIIKKFNDKITDRLYSVDMLNESQNLVEIEIVLIGSLNNVDVANFQRLGRSLRGEMPIIIVPVVEGTQDEKVFQKFIKGMEDYLVICNTPNEVANEIAKGTY